MVRMPYSWKGMEWMTASWPASAVAKVPKPTHQTGYIHAPRGEGEGDADGSGGAVAQPSQLLTGDLGLIGDGTHHVTHEQGGEVVGEEHQNTQRSAHDLSNAGRDVKLLIEFVGHGLNGAGLLEEGHHDTDEHLDTDDPDEIGIAQSTLNDAGEAEQQVLTGDQQTHQNAAQDGEQASLVMNAKITATRAGARERIP